MAELMEIISTEDYRAAVDRALKELKENRIISRIFSRDHSVWKDDPTEISNRLGWLDSPETMVKNLPEIKELVDAVSADGYTDALLLGMGGSSLAPEVFRLTFGVNEGCLDLSVLDSTDPDAVLFHSDRLDPSKTLFIASTKSGGTVETLSFIKYFYCRTKDALGAEEAGRHFIAITDVGSGLAELAGRLNFRKVFLNDPDIGGRYSVLSYFGLVPAALMGMDVRRLLDNARAMAKLCREEENIIDGKNPGAVLGAVMGDMASTGRDKLTLILSPPIARLGIWLEQLIAESVGKDGKGILPVEGEYPEAPDIYTDDRFFVYIRLDGDDTHDEKVSGLKKADFPFIQINLKELYDLGGEFFRWEMATAIAGQRLGVNPFDQPNVESAKVLAREMIALYHKDRKLPELTASLKDGNISVYTDISADTAGEALKKFLSPAMPGQSYTALQAFVHPTSETEEALQMLRRKIQTGWNSAATIGYGPRFLHSTGQLHKGDAGHGLFIQFTSDNHRDAAIPDEPDSPDSSITFGVLKTAQALGDRQALLDNGRKVIRFHLGDEVVEGIKRLADELE